MYMILFYFGLHRTALPLACRHSSSHACQACSLKPLHGAQVSIKKIYLLNSINSALDQPRLLIYFSNITSLLNVAFKSCFVLKL